MKRLRAALVVTLSTACASPRAPEPVQVSHNPPAPMPSPPPTPEAPTCPPRGSIQVGATCANGLECFLPTGGCQPPGYRCDDGHWREVSVTCNPPPPPRP
ncbi:MAG: hypothetical protein U0325_23455 [Polyangiales bacterium]